MKQMYKTWANYNKNKKRRKKTKVKPVILSENLSANKKVEFGAKNNITENQRGCHNIYGTTKQFRSEKKELPVAVFICIWQLNDT